MEHNYFADGIKEEKERERERRVGRRKRRDAPLNPRAFPFTMTEDQPRESTLYSVLALPNSPGVLWYAVTKARTKEEISITRW